MVTLQEIEQVLDDYTDQFVPAMLCWNYHLILVKGGPDYPHLSEQSHFAHIVNGVFGLTQLLKFLVAQEVPVPGLDEVLLRKTLALYTIHDLHKDSEIELQGKSSFSIPLERLREEYERLELDKFAEVDEHLMRAANVHKRSSKHGDLLISDDSEAGRLWLLVRIADTLASVKTPEEAIASLRGYLADLGPFFTPKSPPGQYALYHHQIKDVRGVLTHLIHQATAEQLKEEYGLSPLLYFATGTLYVGTAQVKAPVHEEFIKEVVDSVLSVLTRYANTGAKEAALTGLRKRRYDFEDFVYSFADVGTLLEIAKERATGAKGDVGGDIDSLLSKKDLPEDWNRENVAGRLGIDLEQPDAFMDHWYRARYYLMYADHIVDKLHAESSMEWFLEAFELPSKAAESLRQVADVWGKGGFGKYVVPVAYNFLKGAAFDERAAEALPPEKVLDKLHQHTLEEMEKLDTRAGRKGVVAELGFRQDLIDYLNEHLYLSFAPGVHLSDDALAAYDQVKKKGHSGKMCSLCNRQSKYVQDLRTGILDDFGRIFSNRVLPAREAPGKNRPWCPICHLEFIFRKMLGLGLPRGASYGNSYRIFLYVLPTFSFTPEHLKLFQPLLDQFQQVTNLSIRDYGEDAPGAPRLWLEKRKFDSYWVEDLMNALDRQTTKIAEWGGRSYVGERLHTSPVRAEPHYYLIIWEKAARDRERNDTKIATRTEAWAKALFAATVISGLTSCKVYVTERPYLPMADPADLKPIITLESPPPALRGLLSDRTDNVSLYGREQGERSELEVVLDLSAALWTATTNLQPGKDKDIAGRLGRLNVDPLAGAHFYKEYGRENEGKSPYPTFTTACKVLLDIRGGELMDLVERIASKSLEIALPWRTSGRGKARRYELVFREAVSAMRKAQRMIPEMRKAAISGQRPPKQSISELKRLAAGTLLKGLERRQERKRGDITIRAWGDELGRLVGEFIDILVDDLYLGRAKGNFARFLRLENSLADGIYYYTDRNLSQLWDEHKQQEPADKAASETEE
jgi:hypothetical protein